MPLRSQTRGGKVSIKSRIGIPMGGRGPGSAANSAGSIKSRLGFKNAAGGNRAGAMRAGNSGTPVVIATTAITDARQKINLNRVKTGRITDARNKIQRIRIEQRNHPAEGLRGGMGIMRGGFRSPVKTLTITTDNVVHSPPGSAGIFQSAVSRMGRRSPQFEFQSSYSRFPEPPSPPTLLTRTVANPHAHGGIRRTTGMYSASGPINHRRREVGGMAVNRSRFPIPADFREDSDMDDDEDMEMMDQDSPPPIRLSLKDRLDAPNAARNRVVVSNLQGSVTKDDITELFADVGDLISSKMIGTGKAEIWYKTKQDCLKAIDAYNNRLLDGSPMKVILLEDSSPTPEPATTNRGSNTIRGLKSAAGASMKIPKSNNSLKIQPDLNAIHKVLFQPTSTSNTVKGLFKGGAGGTLKS